MGPYRTRYLWPRGERKPGLGACARSSQACSYAAYHDMDAYPALHSHKRCRPCGQCISSSRILLIAAPALRDDAGLRPSLSRSMPLSPARVEGVIRRVESSRACMRARHSCRNPTQVEIGPSETYVGLERMAENGGFEPPIELSPYNGLANRRLQPLGQLSVLFPASADVIIT